MPAGRSVSGSGGSTEAGTSQSSTAIGNRSNGDRQVLVSDPLFPDSIVDYDEFVSAYQSAGHWTGTILLQG